MFPIIDESFIFCPLKRVYSLQILADQIFFLALHYFREGANIHFKVQRPCH